MTRSPTDERLRALAHAERRRILILCRSAPQTAGDLAQQIDMTAASVSEHLKVLRKTGLATVEKRGRFWLYRTNTALLAETLSTLQRDLLARSGDDA